LYYEDCQGFICHTDSHFAMQEHIVTENYQKNLLHTSNMVVLYPKSGKEGFHRAHFYQETIEYQQNTYKITL